MHLDGLSAAERRTILKRFSRPRKACGADFDSDWAELQHLLAIVFAGEDLHRWREKFAEQKTVMRQVWSDETDEQRDDREAEEEHDAWLVRKWGTSPARLKAERKLSRRISSTCKFLEKCVRRFLKLETLRARVAAGIAAYGNRKPRQPRQIYTQRDAAFALCDAGCRSHTISDVLGCSSQVGKVYQSQYRAEHRQSHDRPHLNTVSASV